LKANPDPPEKGMHRLAIRAPMDRRRAEALALELRRRVKELGFGNVSLTIVPERIQNNDGGGRSAASGGDVNAERFVAGDGR
jgi:hypothetical protein